MRKVKMTTWSNGSVPADVSSERMLTTAMFNGFKRNPTLKHTQADLSLTAAVDEIRFGSPSLVSCTDVDMTARITVHICTNHTPKKSFLFCIFLILQPFESIPS